MLYDKTDMGVLYCGDSLDVLRTLPANSIDSIVTDPPYGISFMGKKWDYDVPTTELWAECLRVLKPGGHLLAFAGTRTQHRMAVRIEDAGFEIRDMIAWVYGTGFTKSLNVSKAIDKHFNANREPVLDNNGNQVWTSQKQGKKSMFDGGKERPATYPATYWEGWGTALKPALEPVTVARKPISEKNIVENVLKHGTGGMNIDGCRVEADADYHELNVTQGGDHFSIGSENKTRGNKFTPKQGRFPANLIHDGSDAVLGLFPQTGKSSGGRIGNKGSMLNMCGNKYMAGDPGFGDSGSAARFFYCAKASKSERNAGCEELPFGEPPASARSKAAEGRDNPLGEPRQNFHPTVKPIALMQYLIRLVTPHSGIVLDPFFGSGSTGCAAIREGYKYIGIDLNPEYCEIAKRRIDKELQQITCI